MLTTTHKILITGFAMMLLALGAIGYLLVNADQQATAYDQQQQSQRLSEQREANRIAERQADIAAQQCYNDKLQAYRDDDAEKRIAEGKAPLSFGPTPPSLVMTIWKDSCRG